MGSCSSATGSAVAADVQGSIAGNGHGESHRSDDSPMWVVKVEHVMAMTSQFRPHQILKAEGLLEKWNPTMFVVFVSHQWFSHNHPDPNGTKLQVLQGLLSNLIARKLKINLDVISSFNGGVQRDVEIQRLQTAHVWLDYFSIPQLVDGYPATSAENQLKYIEAIPSFVGHCDVFLAVVPSDRHSDTGLPCNFNSWLQRGWCRTELWCHVLSVRSEHPIVVVRSPDLAQYTAPVWHRYPVHMGDFSVEEDRARCCQVLQRALANHVSQLGQSKRKTAYRLYLSLFEETTGLEPKCRSVEDFLQEFSFSTVAGQRKDHSLSPVACAALSGDCRLVRALMVARASIQNHAPAMPEVLNTPGFTPLHLALWFKSHDLHMLETLLDLRADPNSSGTLFCTPLSICRSVGAADLLVQRGAGVNFCGANFAQNLPIQMLGAMGAPCEVVAHIIELKADVRGGHRGIGSASPLHNLAYAGDSWPTADQLSV